jgi:hypothetical protein
VPTNARKRHRIGTGGPWGTGLLVLGIAVTVQGISYVAPRDSPLSGPLRALSSVIPFEVFGALWVAAGLYAIWKALHPPQQHPDVWPIVGVVSLWAFTHLAYWLVLGVGYGSWTRAWTSGVAWGMLGAYIISQSRCVNPPAGR